MSPARFGVALAATRAALVLVITFFSMKVQAYPWMNRHGYTSCATCHADPSGAGLLTRYGRAQSELLLSSRYTKGETDEEPSRYSDALFGIARLPDWLLVGGWVRSAYLWNSSEGSLVDHRFLQMRADAAAQITVGRFRASAVAGYASSQSAALTRQAWITSNDDGANLVSREHWLGWDASDEVLVRVGRMNLPFGLRNFEHTSWVRSETRTDFNQQQQHGIAAALNAGRLRAEAMVIAGNYQVRPDAYRERGLSAYAELTLAPGQAIGLSTLVARSERDLGTRRETLRQAHGLFARLSPWKPLVFLGEGDVLVTSVADDGSSLGFAGLLQGDVELIQGIHGIATLEALRRPRSDAEWGVGTWLSAAWFVVSHFDVRVDLVRRVAHGAPSTMTYLVQLQGYL